MPFFCGKTLNCSYHGHPTHKFPSTWPELSTWDFFWNLPRKYIVVVIEDKHDWCTAVFHMNIKVLSDKKDCVLSILWLNGFPVYIGFVQANLLVSISCCWLQVDRCEYSGECWFRKFSLKCYFVLIVNLFFL